MSPFFQLSWDALSKFKKDRLLPVSGAIADLVPRAHERTPHSAFVLERLYSFQSLLPTLTIIFIAFSMEGGGGGVNLCVGDEVYSKEK